MLVPLPASRAPHTVLAVGAREEAAQPLSAAAGVGQILQDGFEFELDISVNHCICRWAASGRQSFFYWMVIW